MSDEIDVLPANGESEESSGRLGEMKERAERDCQRQHWIAFSCGIAFFPIERLVESIAQLLGAVAGLFKRKSGAE
jgi:hypothetical protein